MIEFSFVQFYSRPFRSRLLSCRHLALSREQNPQDFSAASFTRSLVPILLCGNSIFISLYYLTRYTIKRDWLMKTKLRGKTSNWLYIEQYQFCKREKTEKMQTKASRKRTADNGNKEDKGGCSGLTNQRKATTAKITKAARMTSDIQ